MFFGLINMNTHNLGVNTNANNIWHGKCLRIKAVNARVSIGKQETWFSFNQWVLSIIMEYWVTWPNHCHSKRLYVTASLDEVESKCDSTHGKGPVVSEDQNRLFVNLCSRLEASNCVRLISVTENNLSTAYQTTWSSRNDGQKVQF